MLFKTNVDSRSIIRFFIFNQSDHFRVWKEERCCDFQYKMLPLLLCWDQTIAGQEWKLLRGYWSEPDLSRSDDLDWSNLIEVWEVLSLDLLQFEEFNLYYFFKFFSFWFFPLLDIYYSDTCLTTQALHILIIYSFLSFTTMLWENFLIQSSASLFQSLVISTISISIIG
jgi:hypothetical protein